MKMTVSLLEKFAWYSSCPPSWKDQAMQDLKDSLVKGFTGSVATERGALYEARVNKILFSNGQLYGIEEPLNILKGMAQQKWINPLTVSVQLGKNKLDFTFRGKMDYFGKLADTKIMPEGWEDQVVIADLKTTSSAKVSQKRYASSWQHVVYCLAANVPFFSYFVAHFDSDTTLDPDSLSVFPMRLSKTLDAERAELTDFVKELVMFLKAYNLWDDYFKVFNGGQP